MKHLFLALLSTKPTHGYDLLQTYESLFSTVLPPLNAGQIYTTLSRLERDGLVEDDPVEQEGKPDKRIYRITENGKAALLEWFQEPLRGPRIRDNFYFKLIGGRMSGMANLQYLIDDQRKQYLQSLHDLNELALRSEIANDPTKFYLIQGAVLHLKADLEWLDMCEQEFVND